jgi:hypothetical protein
MKDFTVEIYKLLLDELILKNYSFQRFDEFLMKQKERSIILRHDVDKKPHNSLEFARIQNKKGISGVYYFRAKSCSWDEAIIKEISDLGHEIGYHYENLSTSKGNFDNAIVDFEKNLTRLRKLVPIKTICMHGSPLSKFDNKLLWNKINYKDYDLLGEPYFDIDFSKVLYLTDTGRCWNNNSSNIRDKVSTIGTKINVKSTNDIIIHSQKIGLPKKIMFNFHPQRWTNSNQEWFIEYVSQKLKNQIKRLINLTRH